MFPMLNPLMSMGFANPMSLVYGGSGSIYSGQRSVSPGFSTGKLLGDGIQKGDWLSALQGLVGLGSLVANYSYQDSMINYMNSAKSYFFNPLGSVSQWPTGIPITPR